MAGFLDEAWLPAAPPQTFETFDPFFYSSGESTTAFTDNQTVDYGFGGTNVPYTPPQAVPSYGGPGIVDYAINGTPETLVSDYGTINTPVADYSHEGRAYPTPSSARNSGRVDSQPVSVAGVGAIAQRIVDTVAQLGRSAGGASRPSVATPPQTNAPGQRPLGPLPRNRADSEARARDQFNGQLGANQGMPGAFGLPPLILIGAALVAAPFLFKLLK